MQLWKLALLPDSTTKRGGEEKERAGVRGVTCLFVLGYRLPTMALLMY